MSEHLCGLCEIGSYEGMIELVAPSWSSKKTICVDICLSMEITNLWKVGIRTTGCCCGHGKALGYIGVWEEDIERMLDLGYEVRPNETDTSRRDGFYPKTKFNTRAVPDVPELVRYGNYIDNRMHVKPTGEYVLYSQAAAMLAAKDAEIERLKLRNTDEMNDFVLMGMARDEFKNRAEAAEAKLAQHEAQEAAPAADLKAKCDRYEQTLRGIAELSATGMSFGDLVFAVTISRAALNVEASHDKG